MYNSYSHNSIKHEAPHVDNFHLKFPVPVRMSEALSPLFHTRTDPIVFHLHPLRYSAPRKTERYRQKNTKTATHILQ